MLKYRSVPWKRNFNRIPNSILAKLNTIESTIIVVAATKNVRLSDIENGIYKHLNLKIENGHVSGTSIVPPADMGKYSERNRNIWEVVRRDLPKITKTYTWETPNFGDASTYGTHMHSQEREVYQREYYEPQHLTITPEVLNYSANYALLKFQVDSLLNREQDKFLFNLLFCLNLLQENTGVADIFPSTATKDDFIKTVTLHWEFFPPGTAEQVLSFFKGKRPSSPHAHGVMEKRTKLFSSLNPKRYLRGTGGFGSYIGAQYADDLVVFENPNYGNALYVLYDNWEDVSKRSRIDILKGTDKHYDRFVHTEGWEDRFIEHIKTELRRRGNKRLL